VPFIAVLLSSGSGELAFYVVQFLGAGSEELTFYVVQFLGAGSHERVESFNGRMREECLNLSWFQNLSDARRKIAAWRKEYNEERPHSSPAVWDTNPKEFAQAQAAGFYTAVRETQTPSLSLRAPLSRPKPDRE